MFVQCYTLSATAQLVREEGVAHELEQLAARVYKLQSLLASGESRKLPRPRLDADEALEDLYRRRVELD